MKKKTSVSNAIILDRGIKVLLAIRDTPIATTTEIREQVLSELSLRSAQRYLKSLMDLDLVYIKKGGKNDHYRYFLTDKAKQLFWVAA